MAWKAPHEDWLQRLRLLPCGVCGAPGPSYAHHIRLDQGTSQKADDFLTIPLCWECHQGAHGIHGDRQRWVAEGVSELTVLAVVIRQQFMLMRTKR